MFKSVHTRCNVNAEALAHANALVRRSFGEEPHSGASLSEIVERILWPYNHMITRIEGSDIFVSERSTNDLALVFRELATNAAKYGSLSHAGSVTVQWQSDATTLTIDWTETGGPSPVAPERTGFGTMLVSSTIASHDGKLSYDWRPEDSR